METATRKKCLAALFLSIALLALLVILAMVLPETALAAPEDGSGDGSWLDGILDALNGLSPVNALLTWLSDLMTGLCVSLFNFSMQLMQSMSDGTVITDFNKLFGNDSTQVYEFAKAVNKGLVTSVGYTFLAIVMLIKLANLGQRMDGNGTLPAVKEVLWLVVWYAVLLFLINNSMELCEATYAIVMALIKIVRASAPTMSQADFVEIGADDIAGFSSFESLVILAFIMLLFFLAAGATLLITQVVVWGRAIQLYAYSAFAPIALPFLGTDETKPWALGFIKSYLALCLTGAFIVFILLIYPFVMAIAFTDIGSYGGFTPLELILWLLKCMAFFVVLIYALVKTGSWSRELLGG